MPIVPVDEGNRADACRLLARAFRDDPVVRWTLGPNPKRDDAMFRFVGEFHRAPGSSALYLDDDGHQLGAAIWDPPGYRPGADNWRSGLRALATFGTRIRRGVTIDALFTKLRPKEPHWYLSTIGAIHQGRGIGSALLEHRLGQISGPAYLESSNRANLPLYERYGFEVVDEITLPMDGPPVWPMYRQG
ncbi:GNAT family N-acetyltransferase [Gordonia crocea]|uniref:Putative acetyltransferase n=1 Tax=Gordonia crocea TaxID=589162 RepID=A0A7I9UVC5_9ACTN|nr:GNAT family N-acetyltransferase [Gordonia crocea]GED97138.1 putative acetyltransferase [Gordonia crocea]